MSPSTAPSFPGLEPLPAGLQPAAIAPDVVVRPLFQSGVRAGFPSPATDYIEKSLDLNTFLIRNAPATFFFRIEGDSMAMAGIFPGDLVTVDRSITPRSGHIVLAVVDGEYTVKRLYRRGSIVELRPENPAYQAIRIEEGQELQVWGVVTGAVRKFF